MESELALGWESETASEKRQATASARVWESEKATGWRWERGSVTASGSRRASASATG
jgi:hypothetical protein